MHVPFFPGSFPFVDKHTITSLISPDKNKSMSTSFAISTSFDTKTTATILLFPIFFSRHFTQISLPPSTLPSSLTPQGHKQPWHWINGHISMTCGLVEFGTEALCSSPTRPPPLVGLTVSCFPASSPLLLLLLLAGFFLVSPPVALEPTCTSGLCPWFPPSPPTILWKCHQPLLCLWHSNLCFSPTCQDFPSSSTLFPPSLSFPFLSSFPSI